MTIKRGDIYYADLSPVVGSEQGGVRPVLIVQNNVGNKYSPTVIAAAITSQKFKTNLPTHISVNANDIIIPFIKTTPPLLVLSTILFAIKKQITRI